MVAATLSMGGMFLSMLICVFIFGVLAGIYGGKSDRRCWTICLTSCAITYAAWLGLAVSRYGIFPVIGEMVAMIIFSGGMSLVSSAFGMTIGWKLAARKFSLSKLIVLQLCVAAAIGIMTWLIVG